MIKEISDEKDKNITTLDGMKGLVSGISPNPGREDKEVNKVYFT